MSPAIDALLYPDRPAPDNLAAEADAADYLLRVCGAYEFGIPPSPATLATLRGLRGTFDRFPLTDSMAYHALRRWFGWPELPHVGPVWNPAAELELREGRPPDAVGI